MTKNSQSLLSIGELSKLTGVNIKSIRYYEEIGVLPPAYVNSENGYRYYSYSQANMVHSIQFYVAMDIPLSELHRFIDKDNNAVNFKEQIIYGIEVATQKEQAIQNRIRHARSLISEINRSDAILRANEPTRGNLPKKTCWVLPIQGKLTMPKYNSTLLELLSKIKKIGGQTGTKVGMIKLTSGNRQNSFVFAEFYSANKNEELAISVVHIPAGAYYSVSTPFIDIDSDETIRRFIGDGMPSVIILSELFTSEYNPGKLIFELRWSSMEAI